MTLSRIVLLLTLSTGCASVSHDARSANAAKATPDGEAGPVMVAGEGVAAGDTRAASDGQAAAPLRHFYLLSPGPNATLVVTRSDLILH